MCPTCIYSAQLPNRQPVAQPSTHCTTVNPLHNRQPVAQPDIQLHNRTSSCTTGHPVAQRVIPLHNQTSSCTTEHPVAQPDIQLHNGSSRYVTGLDFCYAANLSPEQKSGLHKDIWLLRRCKKGIHQFYLPL